VWIQYDKDINLYVVKVGVAIYLDLLGMPLGLFVNLCNALLGHATPRTPAMYFNLFVSLNFFITYDLPHFQE
jgi:hypothetical protein